MRDYTGLDSIISPCFCLFVMVSVWALERMFPSRDILFFIPKAWRMTEPLYQLTDDQALKETADSMGPTAANASGLGKEVGRDSVAEDLDSFDVNGVKDNKGVSLGRRPSIQDDSAHYGRESHVGANASATGQHLQGTGSAQEL
jgi:hypothetical protein